MCALCLARGAVAAEPTAGSTASASASVSPGGAGAASDVGGDQGAADQSSGSKREWVGIDVGLRVGFALPFGNLAIANGPAFPTMGGVGGALFSGDQALRDTFDGHVPIQLDLGYRITDSLVVGAYGLWGKGILAGKSPFSCDDRLRSDFVGQNADSGGDMAMTGDAATMAQSGKAPELSCSASVVRAGLQVRYHFQPHDEVDPWLGVGTGFEVTTISSGDLKTSATFSGFEFVNLNAGLEIELIDSFRVGPYGQFAVGRYGTVPASSKVYESRYQCPGADCTLAADAVKTGGAHYWVTGGIRTSYVF